jgi:hypothetical protein
VLKPVRFAETFTSVVPDPAAWLAVCEPYDVVVPYWNEYVVDCPEGFTVPFSVAEVEPIEPAAPVVTAGGDPVAASVVNASSNP